MTTAGQLNGPRKIRYRPALLPPAKADCDSGDVWSRRRPEPAYGTQKTRRLTGLALLEASQRAGALCLLGRQCVPLSCRKHGSSTGIIERKDVREPLHSAAP
jgi:hypothetical protein